MKSFYTSSDTEDDQTVARNILDVRYGQRRRYILTYMVNNKTDFYETLSFEKTIDLKMWDLDDLTTNIQDKKMWWQ